MIRWLALALLITLANPAFAACSNPAMPKGTIYFNSAYDALHYCNDADWVMMGIGSYNPEALTFDGTADYLTRGADLTGNADSNKITGSFWVRRNGGLGSVMYIHANTFTRVYVTLAADNTVRIHGDDTGGTAVLDLKTTSTITDGNWHHVIVSIDLSDTAKRFIYLDGVAETLNVTTYNTAGTIDFTQSDHSIGAAISGINKLNGDLADVWFDFGTHMDLSIAANRAKFRSASGMPMYLGPDGAIPTGSKPDIFLSGSTASWESNKGTGGGFTENGALTTATTQPADSIVTGTCTGPSRPAGVMFYNIDYRTMQYCNGKEWVAMGALGGGQGWKQVSAGTTHTCAVKTDGTLWCWGDDTSGQLGNGAGGNATSPVQESTGATDWASVTAGNAHSCAVKTTGALFCWGSDATGQIGNGATTGNQVSPVQESTGATDWASVTAGNAHSCAVKTTGALFCWGSDATGQIGNGATTGNQVSPVQESTAATNWSSVAAGNAHSCAVKTTGALFCWGSDATGQIGNGATTGNQVSPVQESTAATNWASVAAGGTHSCAVKTTGALFCWGDDASGQIGNGATTGNQVSPVQESTTATNWASVAAGGTHSCAVKTTGALFCWGDDTEGQLANGANGNEISPAQESAAATDWTQVAAGGTHSCAVKSGGMLWCWGDDESGQLGNGAVTGDQESLLQESTAATNWASVDPGSTHTCARKTNGAVFCWGSDASSQLGNGAVTGDQISPVQETTAATDWAQISGGSGSHSCAVKTNGTLWCWGSDNNGRLGNGATTGNQDSPSQESTAATDWAQVSAGSGHTCAVKTNGTLWCWGDDTNGELGNGATTGDQISPSQESTAATDWAQVAAGGALTCAVKTTGTLWCWGDDGNGEVGNGAVTGDQISPSQEGTAATDWAQVAVSTSHGCARKTTGTVWCWGSDSGGRLGNGAGGSTTSPGQESTAATDWAQVSAAWNHSCAVKTNGTLWCWGSDLSGQIGNGATTGNQVSPVQEASADTDWAAVAGDGTHTCAVKSGGTLWCWGEDANGRLGVGIPLGNSPVNTEVAQPGACTGPALPEGVMFYNTDYSTMQYCNGASWVGIGK